MSSRIYELRVVFLKISTKYSYNLMIIHSSGTSRIHITTNDIGEVGGQIKSKHRMTSGATHNWMIFFEVLFSSLPNTLACFHLSSVLC